MEREGNGISGRAVEGHRVHSVSSQHVHRTAGGGVPLAVEEEEFLEGRGGQLDGRPQSRQLGERHERRCTPRARADDLEAHAWQIHVLGKALPGEEVDAGDARRARRAADRCDGRAKGGPECVRSQPELGQHDSAEHGEEGKRFAFGSAYHDEHVVDGGQLPVDTRHLIRHPRKVFRRDGRRLPTRLVGHGGRKGDVPIPVVSGGGRPYELEEFHGGRARCEGAQPVKPCRRSGERRCGEEEEEQRGEGEAKHLLSEEQCCFRAHRFASCFEVCKRTDLENTCMTEWQGRRGMFCTRACEAASAVRAGECKGHA